MAADPKFQYEFEYQWGGEDTWYTKSKRWAKKQNPIVQHLALGFIEWLWIKWIEGKVKMEMASVDKQVEEIHEQWDQEDLLKKNTITTSEPSEVPGLDNISISFKPSEPDT